MRIFAKLAWVRGRELARDVTVEVHDGAIGSVEVGSRCDTRTDLLTDLLLPGFINAHCHLEYTALKGKLSGEGSFGEWLDAIIDAKQQLAPEDSIRAARDGVQQLLAGGCTTVIDSCSIASRDYLTGVPVRHFILHEVLGLSVERADDQVAAVLPLLGLAPDGKLLGTGISPHAPYSVGPHLRARLRDLLHDKPELICAWHLAETPDEAQLLSTGAGSIAEFLKKRLLPVSKQKMANSDHCPPLALLEQEDLLDRCDLAFHMNCATPAGHAYFRAPRALVHCPGTHRYFNRPPFPMRDALAAGANVCLGTDSLASSNSLSMLEIIRIAAEELPELSGPQLLDMATRNPAKTRALASIHLGSIDAGYAADFVTLQCEDKYTSSLRQLLCDPSTSVHSTIIAGETVYSA